MALRTENRTSDRFGIELFSGDGTLDPNLKRSFSNDEFDDEDDLDEDDVEEDEDFEPDDDEEDEEFFEEDEEDM